MKKKKNEKAIDEIVAESERLGLYDTILFQNNPAFDQERAQANHELLELLTNFLTENPKLRFGQVLNILEMTGENIKMIESRDLLRRAKCIVEKINRVES